MLPFKRESPKFQTMPAKRIVLVHQVVHIRVHPLQHNVVRPSRPRTSNYRRRIGSHTRYIVYLCGITVFCLGTDCGNCLFDWLSVRRPNRGVAWYRAQPRILNMLDYNARGRVLQPYNFNLTGAETDERINYRYIHETARLFLVSTFFSVLELCQRRVFQHSCYMQTITSPASIIRFYIK